MFSAEKWIQNIKVLGKTVSNAYQRAMFTFLSTEVVICEFSQYLIVLIVRDLYVYCTLISATKHLVSVELCYNNSLTTLPSLVHKLCNIIILLAI